MFLNPSQRPLQDAYDSAKGKAQDIGSDVKGQAKVGALLSLLPSQVYRGCAMFSSERIHGNKNSFLFALCRMLGGRSSARPTRPAARRTRPTARQRCAETAGGMNLMMLPDSITQMFVQ